MVFIATVTVWNQVSGDYKAQQAVLARTFEMDTPLSEVWAWYSDLASKHLGYGDLTLHQDQAALAQEGGDG